MRCKAILPFVAFFALLVPISVHGQSFQGVPSSLKDGEEVIMARRLRQFFLEEGGRPTAAPNAASARDHIDEHTIQNGGTA